MKFNRNKKQEPNQNKQYKVQQAYNAMIKNVVKNTSEDLFESNQADLWLQAKVSEEGKIDIETKGFGLEGELKDKAFFTKEETAKLLDQMILAVNKIFLLREQKIGLETKQRMPSFLKKMQHM